MRQVTPLDRPWLGLWCGLAGGVAMNAWSYFLYKVVRLAGTWNARIMSAAIFRHQPRNGVEQAVGVLYDLTFASLLGGILAVLLPLLGRRHLRVLGWFFGVSVSLVALILSSFLAVPVFPRPDGQSILFHFTTASVWGLATTHLLLWFGLGRSAD